MEGEPHGYDAAEIWRHVNGAAEKYKRAGLYRMATARYQRDGEVTAAVEIYSMRAGGGAEDIYRQDAPIQRLHVDLGDGGQLSETRLSFHQGPCYVRIIAERRSPGLKGHLTALGQAVLGEILRQER